MGERRSADWVSFVSTLASVAVTVFSIMFLSLQVRAAVWRGRRLLHASAVGALVEVLVPVVASLIVAMGGHRWHWAAWVAGGLGLVMVALHSGIYARELGRARGLPRSLAGASPHILRFEHDQAKVSTKDFTSSRLWADRYEAYVQALHRWAAQLPGDPPMDADRLEWILYRHNGKPLDSV
jgi:hypothetical protein